MADIDFRRTTVAALADQVSSRERSARELTEAALARIDEVNPLINAFVALDGDRAMDEAAAIDERIAAGEDVGPLAGIPIGVKDLEDAAGFRTTQGSFVHADDPPATADSSLVERLRAAGCVVLGKTNTPELGFKADTDNPVFGATRNPWNVERSAGGSSGGSAAAVAAGMVPACDGLRRRRLDPHPRLAVRADGAEAVARARAAGRFPTRRAGCSCRRAARWRARSATSRWRSTRWSGPTRPTCTRCRCRTRGRGRSPSCTRRGASVGRRRSATRRSTARSSAVCEGALAALEERGAEIVEIDTVFPEDPGLDWLAMSSTFNLRSLGHLRDTPMWSKLDPGGGRDDGLGSRQRERGRPRSRAGRVPLRQPAPRRAVPPRAVVLLTPTVAGQTGPIGGQGYVNGEESPYWVAFTYPFNMTRSPAGTVCAGFTDDGMPVGLQVVGPQHADVAVLRLLALLEDSLGLDPIAPM